MRPTKVIGILGGAGALATANFFSALVAISQTKYQAEQDTDFPSIYLYNMPMEGFDETGFSNPESVKQQLINGVKKIENWGADFIVLPCNTVHYFLNDMQAAVSIPILSILNATIETVKNHHHTKIGILSSASTRLLELYKKPFEEHGFETVITSDEEQTAVDSVILTIMAGNHGSKELAVLKTIVQRMSQSGAQAIVLACTELPLALSQKDIDIPLFDTLNILVEHTADEAYKKIAA